MRTIHSSSALSGRAFSAGNEPTIPAVHCAITRSGLETMNSGAPITGSRSRERTGGSDIGAILAQLAGARSSAGRGLLAGEKLDTRVDTGPCVRLAPTGTHREVPAWS